MAVGEIFAKGLVVIKGDTAHARAEISKLSAEEQKAAKARVKAQEEHNAAMERSNQRFQLYAAGAVAGWALVSKSVKTYEEHLKSLGASGESELKKLQRTSDALTGAQKSLEIAIARVAMAAAPAADELARMAGELANIVGAVGDVLNVIPGMPGGGSVRKWTRRLTPGIGQVSWLLDEARGVYGNIRATGTEDRGEWNMVNSAANPDWVAQQIANQNRDARYSLFTGKSSSSQSLLGEEGTQAIQYIDQESGRLLARTLRGKAEKFFTNAGRGLGMVEGNRAGGGRGSRQYSDPLSDIFGYARDTFDQSGLGNLGDIYAAGGAANEDRAAKFGGLGGIGSKWSSIEIPQSLLDQLNKGEGEIRDSMLEKVFGPIEEFNQYAAGFDLLKTASQSAFAAWIDGSKGAGQAFKDAAIASLTANATELLGTGLSSIGHGIVHLAMGNPKGPGEIAAGAKAIAQAAVIGGLAKGLGGGHHSSSAITGNSYAAAGIGGGPRPASGPGGGNTTIIIGDSLGYESPRSQAQRIGRGLDLAEERTRRSRSVTYA